MAPATPDADPAGWWVGAGSAAIDLPATVPLAGYALRAGPATGIHDAPHVRVAALRQGPARAAIAVLDLLYVPMRLAGIVRQAVAAELAMDPDAVLVAATHTHCGPAGLAVPSPLDDAVRDAAVTASRAAADAGESARLAVASPYLPGVAANRRRAGDPADPTARVLVAAAAADPGRILLTVLNFACHATVLGPSWRQVSADFPGVACARIEAAVGGTAIYLQGCAGDVNPARIAPVWGECERIGGVLAAAATGAVLQSRAALRGLRVESPTYETDFDVTSLAGAREVTGTLAVARREVAVRSRAHAPLHGGAGTAGDAATARPADPADAPARSRRWIEDLLDRDPSLFGMVDPGPPDRLQVRIIRLAPDVAIVALPGEPFTATAAALREAAGGDLLVAGYAGQAVAYLPPADEWALGGYEVGCCLYTAAAEGALRRAALDLLRG